MPCARFDVAGQGLASVARQGFAAEHKKLSCGEAVAVAAVIMTVSPVVNAYKVSLVLQTMREISTALMISTMLPCM